MVRAKREDAYDMMLDTELPLKALVKRRKTSQKVLISNELKRIDRQILELFAKKDELEEKLEIIKDGRKKVKNT